MAFRINNPEVGATLLKTFATFAEENRRRQQLDVQANQALQNLAIKEMGVTLRERALDQQKQNAQDRLLLGLGNLEQRIKEGEQRTKEAAIRIADRQGDLDAQEGDLQAAVDLSEMMTVPNDAGKSLSQRLHSADPAEAAAAIREFGSLADRFASRGPRTQATIRNIEARLNAQQRQALGAERERRMASQAEAAAKKSAETGQRGLIKDQSSALRRQIKEAEKQYQELYDQEAVAEGDEYKRIKAAKEEAGKKADALKKQLQEIENELLDPLNAPNLQGGSAAVVPELGAIQKRLSVEMAAELLREAGGDRQKAEALARDRGFTF